MKPKPKPKSSKPRKPKPSTHRRKPVAKAPSAPTPKPAPKPTVAESPPAPSQLPAEQPGTQAPPKDTVIASVPMPDPDSLGLRGLIIPTGTVLFDGAFDKNATITISRKGQQLEVTLNTNADKIPAGSWRPHD